MVLAAHSARVTFGLRWLTLVPALSASRRLRCASAWYRCTAVLCVAAAGFPQLSNEMWLLPNVLLAGTAADMPRCLHRQPFVPRPEPVAPLVPLLTWSRRVMAY